MPLDWLNTPVDVPISELIARKKRARTIEALRAQLQGRLAPGVQVRLQLADLLVQAGRQDEAIPVLLGLADEFASDGFVAKAIAILKRVEKVHGGHPDVASRLERLVQQQQRAARVAGAEPARRPTVEFGMEEIADEAPAPEPPAPEPPAPEPPADPVERFDTDTSPLPIAEALLEPPAAPPEAAETPPPPGGVANRIRGVFRRFLASLPATEDAPAEPPLVVAPPPAAEGLAEAPAAESETPAIEVEPEPELASGDLEITLEPEPAELTEQAYEARLLDIVEDVLHRPSPDDAPPDRPRAVEYAHRLLATPLLSDLSEEELLLVVRGLRVHTFDPGDIVVTERQPGQSLYIVTSGAVKVFVRNPSGRNFAVARLGEGDFFGEIASLSGRPRTATVVAAARTDVLELGKATLDGIARTHPRVKDVLESAYIERASSPEAAAIRAVPVSDPYSDRRAIEVLEAHFGESRWDPRMRLRLADVLLRAGKEHDAVPVLVGLADDLAREGYPEKAVAILKKIERLQRRHLEEVNLAPSSKRSGAAPPPPAPPRGSGSVPVVPRTRPRPRTDDRLHDWLLDTVRHAVARPRTGALPAPSPRGYGPGLRASPLFEGFGEEELLALIHGLRLLTFAPGDVIVTEGEPGQSLFILAAGTVKVFVRAPGGGDVAVAALGEGSFFGETSTLSGQPRSATVTAASACDLLEIDRAALDRLGAAHPDVRRVLEDYSRRRAADPAAAVARGRAGA
jgi:CRP-like cAMP-binding protein